MATRHGRISRIAWLVKPARLLVLSLALGAGCFASANAQTKMLVTLPGQTFVSGLGNTGTAGAQTAGTSFNITLTALNGLNFISTGYTGTKTITYSGPGGSPAYTTNVTFNNGQATGVATTLLDAQTTSITATDGALTGVASSSFTVNAGAFTQLQLLMPGETAAPGTATGKTGTPTAQTAGTPFNVTVNAVDANWNLVSSTHTIAISSTDANAALPANAALAGGTKTFAVTFKTAGSWTVTATDATDGTKTANTSPVTAANIGAFARLLLLAPGETAAPGSSPGKTGTPSNQSFNAAFNMTVYAVDANWNLVTSAPANTIKITSSDTNAVLPPNAPLSSGVVNFNITLRTAGSVTVTAANVTDGTKTGSASTISVNPQQPQTITFNALSNQVYGAVTFGLSATASSGLPVSFAVLSGPGTINNTNLTITGVGTVTVQASQAGNINYQAATNVSQSFTVTAAPLAVSSPNQSRFVGQTNPVFNGTVTGLQYSDSITATFSVTATTNSPIGNYPIIPSLTDPGFKLANYAVATNGILSVNPLPTQWAVANGGNGHFYQAIFAPGGISWDQASANATNFGGYLASITSSAENNFIFSLISNTPDYWIADSGGGDGVWIGGIWLGNPGDPANPINWTWVTGEAFSFSSWAFGQPNNINGYQNHIQFYSPSGLTANTWNDAADTLDAAFVPGFVIEYNSNPFASNQTIAFGPLADQAYGTAPFSLSATASSGLTVSFSVLSGPAMITGTTLTITGVGTVNVQAAQAGDNNNKPAPSVNQSFNVTPASLTITANNTNKTYGQTMTFAGTEFTTVGLVNGDSVTNITLASSGAAATSTVAGSPYSIVASAAVGSGLGNYNITYDNGSLTVNPAALGITASNASKFYGQTMTFAGTEFSVTGLLNSDSVTNVSLTSSGAAVTATVAGSPYAIVPGTAQGIGLGNYSIGYGNGALTVNRVALAGMVDGKTRAYGDSNPAFSISYTGFVNSENTGVLTGTPIFSCVDTNNAGVTTNAPVGVYLIHVVSGQSAANYNLTYTDGSLTITQALLLATADDQSRPYGQTNPVFTVTYAGFVNGEDTNVLSGSPALSTPADTNSPVGAYPIDIAVGTLSNANYSFTFSNGTLHVMAYALIINVDSTNRFYGQTNPAFTGAVVGLQNGDSITAGYATVAGGQSPVGTYAITATLQDTGNKLGNYSVTTNAGVLTVNPAALSITASNTSKTYGQTVTFAGTEFTTSGLVNSDTVTSVTLASDGAAATATVAGSPYAIVPSAAVGAGLNNYSLSYINGVLTVNPAATSITWTNPADIVYGTALSGVQLNATGSVPGTLVYTPATGTILNASNAQVLSVTLIPTDPNYSGFSTAVLINVLMAGTTNLVTTSTNPALPGATVTFTSTLSAVAPGGGTPTGTVQFVIDGAPAGAPANLTNGMAVFSTSTMAHGLHSVAGLYAGDNNFTGSSNSLAAAELINTPPVTHVFTLAATENTPVQFSLAKLLATVGDADHDAITLVSMDTNSANGGTITISNATAVYSPPVNSTNADTFNYTVSDSFGATATGVVSVNISPGSGITDNLTGLVVLPNGHVVVQFAGVPNRTYSVQASTDLQNWNTIGSATTGSNGQFSFEDVDAGNFSQRFYRTSYP
jgi:hypothetical protein